MVKRLLIGTILSILVFFSVSFAQVLGSFLTHTNYNLRVGLPVTYYHQYIIDGDVQFGWDIGYLLLDCFIFWVATILIYLLATKKRS